MVFLLVLQKFPSQLSGCHPPEEPNSSKLELCKCPLQETGNTQGKDELVAHSINIMPFTDDSEIQNLNNVHETDWLEVFSQIEIMQQKSLLPTVLQQFSELMESNNLQSWLSLIISWSRSFNLKSCSLPSILSTCQNINYVYYNSMEEEIRSQSNCKCQSGALSSRPNLQIDRSLNCMNWHVFNKLHSVVEAVWKEYSCTYSSRCLQDASTALHHVEDSISISKGTPLSLQYPHSSSVII